MLDPAEREALRAHLETGCPTCAGALAEAQATLALMAASVSPVNPPAGAVDRLMARIEAETPKSGGERRMRIPFVAALLATAAAIAITSGIWLYATRDARSFWNSTNLASVTLASETQPKARGQVLWDHDRKQWRVTATGLAQAAPGREYELWVIPAGGAPIRSQTFRVTNEADTSTFVVDLPANVGPLATAAITDEPLGGTDAPTGKIHLAGQFR